MNQPTLFTNEKCNHCHLKPAICLFHVWHKGQYKYICTGCVLNLYKGDFCPYCFQVFDNPPDTCVECCGCQASCHLDCIPLQSAMEDDLFCPFCNDANKLKFFEIHRDEIMNGVKIDYYLSSQMHAAAVISKKSMEKALKMTKIRAEIECKNSAEAKEKAKEALLFLQQVQEDESGKDDAINTNNPATEMDYETEMETDSMESGDESSENTCESSESKGD
ncbi:hypothetical protein M9H77_00253 [Catharanthus roseus]|nr:hypothetical protein M9H77_00253 [Catharanthus roseus]